MSTVHFFCVLCGTALQSPGDALYDLMQCQVCSRHVPVPRPLTGPVNVSSYPPVLPPEVLELLVTFQCTSCGSIIQADARYEGRDATCPDCHGVTGIPRWSLPPGSRRAAPTRARAAGAKLPTLTIEEIDFLRGPQTGTPEAAA
jgi:DNA-directed RNA polymerase subunit RPC12/RpoP